MLKISVFFMEKLRTKRKKPEKNVQLVMDYKIILNASLVWL